jgi:predicted nicotinamide N-methyase
MPGYLVKHEHIAVDGAADLTIRSLLDRQQFSDPLDAALRLGISSAAWPLFGLLWPSGRRLAAHMAVRPVRAGERILEIGCGLGLASLVSHRRGADVTASDCHPLAAGFLAENLRLNGLPQMAYRHGHWTASGDAPVAWAPGDPPAVHGRFDLIIGSDLLYERDESASLARFIARHAEPAAQVLIVDPDRGNRAAFSRQMGALGYGVTQLRLDRPESDGVPAYKGRLLSYRQPAAAR